MLKQDPLNDWRMPEIRMCKEQICSGDADIVNEFETLAGPVPVAE